MFFNLNVGGIILLFKLLWRKLMVVCVLFQALKQTMVLLNWFLTVFIPKIVCCSGNEGASIRASLEITIFCFCDFVLTISLFAIRSSLFAYRFLLGRLWVISTSLVH